VIPGDLAGAANLGRLSTGFAPVSGLESPETDRLARDASIPADTGGPISGTNRTQRRTVPGAGIVGSRTERLLRHSWLNRLVPALFLVPGSILLAAPAHAATTVTVCDPLVLTASVATGTETAVFKVKNCTTATQKIVLSGKRVPPAGCRGSGSNYGDSPPFSLAAGKTMKFFHMAPAPKCSGIYKVKGDSELKGTETVLDADVATYTV
jgi:hypothetical protein